MAPRKQIKYSGLPSRLSNLKWPSEMIVENYHGNEQLLTHREKNTQRVLILLHLPLLLNYQHMYRKYISSTYYPTKTCLGRKTGNTILVSNLQWGTSIFKRMMPSPGLQTNHKPWWALLQVKLQNIKHLHSTNRRPGESTPPEIKSYTQDVTPTHTLE